VNFVDHTLTDQSSVLRFTEDNWGTGWIGAGRMTSLRVPCRTFSISITANSARAG